MAVVPPYKNLNLQETLFHSFEAAAEILQYQRVKLDATGKVVPGVLATDLTFGVALADMAVGETKAIHLDHPEQFGRSNTLIDIGAAVYAAAGGLVTAVAGGALLGVARFGCPAPGATTNNKQATIPILQVKVTEVA